VPSNPPFSTQPKPTSIQIPNIKIGLKDMPISLYFMRLGKYCFKQIYDLECTDMTGERRFNIREKRVRLHRKEVVSKGMTFDPSY
jgi:hypothetical protein